MQDHTLSSDTIRLMLSAPRLKLDGTLEISQRMGGHVWRLLMECLHLRMRGGATTFVDATHLTRKSLKPYHRLIRQYGYRAHLITLASVPYEICWQRNQQRESIRRVPEEVMHEFAAQLLTFEPPEWLDVITPEQLSSCLQPLTLDLRASPPAKIHFIGDLHGHAAPLREFLHDTGTDNGIFVFTGDIPGRGPDNAELIRWLLSLETPHFLCEGHFERALRNHLLGSPLSAPAKVEEELATAGITRDGIQSFLNQCHEVILLQLPARQIWITHGGLPKPLDPQTIGLLSSDDLILGPGPFHADVDGSFATFAGSGRFQVHAHRNPLARPMDGQHPSLNLAAAGYTRMASLDTRTGDFEFREYVNPLTASETALCRAQAEGSSCGFPQEL